VDQRLDVVAFGPGPTARVPGVQAGEIVVALGAAEEPFLLGRANALRPDLGGQTKIVPSIGPVLRVDIAAPVTSGPTS
jgi:hypothetical protein